MNSNVCQDLSMTQAPCQDLSMTPAHCGSESQSDLGAIKRLRRQKFRSAKLLPTLEVFKLKSGPQTRNTMHKDYI